jgi:hypothetical protein
MEDAGPEEDKITSLDKDLLEPLEENNLTKSMDKKHSKDL